MIRKPFVLRNLLFALAMLPIIAFAQSTIPAEKLTVVSDDMYKHGNENYILVDAVKDGIINMNECYNFTYDDGRIRFNGKELPAEFRKTYEDKMARLLTTSGKGLDTRMYYRGGGVREEDILDENSSFRNKVDHLVRYEEIGKKHEEIAKQHEEIIKQHKEIIKQHEEIIKQHEEIAKEHKAIAKNQTTYTNRIIDAMYNDNLLANKNNVKIKWDYSGVFVNGKKLTGEMANKYEAMFEKETGMKPKSWGDGVSITCTP